MAHDVETGEGALRTLRVRVGSGDDAREIGVIAQEGLLPGVVWLPGFKSDMASSKASALAAWASAEGRACLRFDYSGHGTSEGRFEDGTISRWLEDCLAIIRACSAGPQVVVGSSMGGWLALLVARALAAAGEADRLAGLVLIAPAVDFTQTLMWERFSPAIRDELTTTGRWLRPSAYSPEPYTITMRLIEDGRAHLLFGTPIRAGCPVHILQGMRDPDVPWQHAMTLVEHLAGDPVTLTLVKDGDHRLSREEDLARLLEATRAMVSAQVPRATRIAAPAALDPEV